MSARRVARGRNLALRGFNGRQYLTRALEIEISFGGQRESPGGPIDQPDAKAKFEPRDQLRDRGRRQTDVVRGPGEAASLDDPGKDAHLGRHASHIQEIPS
jgi:hypothetical protein